MIENAGYLTDDEGHKSAIRLFGFITVIAGVGLAYLATWLHSDLGGWLATMLISVAFTGKVVQKQIESENEGPQPMKPRFEQK